MKVRKIAYITGTRADFGLMSPVLEAINTSDSFELQLYGTGVHLMPQFGNTIEHIRKQFPRVKTIPAVFSRDDSLGMAQFTGDYLQNLVKALNNNRPDFILILGDRVEMLCSALASVYLGIPSGHIHGGEKTFTVDEIARHAITKLSNLHFATTADSAKRIRKLGEEPWRIHVVGAPALDVVLNKKLPTREELLHRLGLKPEERFILVLQHPLSEQVGQATRQMEKTLAAVKYFNLPIVVTYPHPDPGGRKIIEVIERERNNSSFHIFPSFEFKDWLVLEREAAVWVGNSSAGIIESGSFKTPVVNIGDRQNGRPQSGNVINVGYIGAEIIKAIKKSLYDTHYLVSLKRIKNRWGDGHASDRILKILSETDFDDKLLRKQITY